MKIFKLSSWIILLMLISSCSKYDDGELWNKVNSLDDRVTSIENQLESLNSNIASISDLADVLQNSLFITNITMSSNGYLLTFSDGSEITISDGVDGKDGEDGVDGKDGKDGVDGADGKDGKDGVDGKDGADGKDAPIINIRYYEGRYYWVQTVNGETTWLTDNEGNKIPASGDDGITPLLRVNADGYWIISYDNGNSFSLLLDENDNAIKASGKDGDSFFQSVEVTEDGLRIVFKDGTEVIIPLGEPQTVYKDVDLGLSVNWATFNMGASEPSELGGLYLWGNVDKNETGLDFTAPDIDNISGSEYDIVHVTLGNSWRMPTHEELQELINECVWERSTLNGVEGMSVTGTNGNTIFIPPTGWSISESISVEPFERQDNENGYYWSGESVILETNRMGRTLYYTIEGVFDDSTWNTGIFKLAIRPVKA